MMVSRIENIYQLNDRGTMKIYSLGEETINSIIEEDKNCLSRCRLLKIISLSMLLMNTTSRLVHVQHISKF